MTAPRSEQLLGLMESLTAAPLSPRTLETARMGILDCTACIVGGAGTPTAEKVRSLAQEQGCSPVAAVLGTRLRLSSQLAAWVNGVAGHVLDYDDMSSTMIAHPSVVLVPTIFALAEPRRATGQEVISAYVFGFEVACWFGRLMSPRHYDAGWHATSSLGVFGTAAAAARLLQLDTTATLNALAIAASNVAGLRGNFGSMTKSLHAGQAAEGGMRAALLSARGFSANVEVFDEGGGFFEAYGTNEKPKLPPTGELEIEASGIGLKPYACCGAGISMIDVALDLREAHSIDPAEIVEVKCVVTDMAYRIMPFQSARDGLQAKYCLAYCAAVALLDGKGGLAEFSDDRVTQRDIQDFLQRVHVTPSSRLTSGQGVFGLEMAVELRDGRVLSLDVELPRGHPRRPMGDEQLEAKFLECAGPLLGEIRARSAAALLQRLETVSDVNAVIELLVTESAK